MKPKILSRFLLLPGAVLMAGSTLNLISPALFCLSMVALMLVSLALELYPPEVALSGTLIVILSTSFFSPVAFFQPPQAFQGFINEGVITIAALYIVAAALRNTGIFESLAVSLLGNGKNDRGTLLKIAFPITALSAFINNTPIVSIFMPILRDWALKKSRAPSKFLIPLSYLTIFGGTCTLIGTSTNLVVYGLAREQGIKALDFFSFAWIGLPCALAGIIYLVVVGQKLLPEIKDPWIRDSEIKKYLIEMVVEPGSRLSGLSIEKAKLRDLQNLFLFEVRRGDNIFAPVKREFILKEGDRLVFSGARDEIINLPKIAGLTVPEACQSFDVGENAQMVEVVISNTSPLRGKTIDEVWFNRKYNAAVLALHRNGEDVASALSTTPLAAGDTLLLVAGLGFRRIWQNSTDFYLVSSIRTDLHKPKLVPASLIITAGMIALPALGIIPILHTSLIAAFLLVLLQSVKQDNVLGHIDWNVLLIIASALGISAALDSSGASALIAKGITGLSMGMGPLAALAIIFIATNVLTETITNNAAAALVFPIGITTAGQLDVSAMPFIMAIAVAASASFSTPIGYQTNLMVYGPGGYKFKHFVKVGLPLNFIFLLGTLLIAPVVWPF